MKQLLLLSLMLGVVLSAGLARAQDGHEYAPIQEKTVNYKNWSLTNLQNNESEDLRSAIHDKKLVMIVYFAPWCPNWRNEAPIAAKLYQKYRDQGFMVIGVSEYASRDDVRKFFGDGALPYPIFEESESRDDREKTAHFSYRQATGDSRRWGSPWNIFLQPDQLAKDGDVLTAKAFVVNGELIEADADKFIADHLKSSSTAITPCKTP